MRKEIQPITAELLRSLTVYERFEAIAKHHKWLKKVRKQDRRVNLNLLNMIYAKTHSEKMKEDNKRWRENNKERLYEYSRWYRENNKEKFREYQRAFKKRHSKK